MNRSVYSRRPADGQFWQVLTFLQTLLDSSFLTFLTYPPPHPILRDIFSHLEPELDFTDDVEQLRGPLEPFVRAHAKAVHEAAHGVRLFLRGA